MRRVSEVAGAASSGARLTELVGALGDFIEPAGAGRPSILDAREAGDRLQREGRRAAPSTTGSWAAINERAA
jgi:hypothetical protein